MRLSEYSHEELAVLLPVWTPADFDATVADARDVPAERPATEGGEPLCW